MFKKKTQGILQKLSIPPTQPRFFHFKTKKRSSRKTQVIRRKTQGIWSKTFKESANAELIKCSGIFVQK